MAIVPISRPATRSPEAPSVAASSDKIRETISKVTSQALCELNDPAADLSDRILDLTLIRKKPEDKSLSPKEFFKIPDVVDFQFDPSQIEKLYDLVKEFKIGTRLCFIDLLGLSMFKRLNIVIDYIDAHYDLKKGGKEHFLKVFFGIYASFTLEMNAIESPGVYKRIERDFQAFMEDLNETLRSAHASRKLALNLVKKNSKKSSVTTLLDKAFNQKEEKALRELISLKELFFAFLQSSCPKDLLFDKRAAQCQGIVDVNSLDKKEREHIVKEIKYYSSFVAYLVDHFDQTTSFTTKQSVKFFNEIEVIADLILIEDGTDGAFNLRKEVSFFMDSRLEALEKIRRMISLQSAEDHIGAQKKRELQLRFFDELVKIGIAIDYANDLEWITDVIVLPFLDVGHHPKVTRYNRVELLLNAILHFTCEGDFEERAFTCQINKLKKAAFERLQELQSIHKEILQEREVAPKATGDAYSLFNFEKKFFRRIYDLISPAIDFSVSQLEEIALTLEGEFSDVEFTEATFWIAQLLMMKEDLEILLFLRRPSSYDIMLNPLHQLLIYSKEEELEQTKDLDRLRTEVENQGEIEQDLDKMSSEFKKEKEQTLIKPKPLHPLSQVRSAQFNPIRVEEKKIPKGRRGALSEEEGKRLWELRSKHTRYLLRELEEMGWIVCKPTNGSHSPVAAFNEKGEMKRCATLPNKGTIAPGTLKSIIKQLENSSLES